MIVIAFFEDSSFREEDALQESSIGWTMRYLKQVRGPLALRVDLSQRQLLIVLRDG